TCGGEDVLCVYFFFSSRRRHTRLVSDWSSDVCSSDLSRTSRSRNGGDQRSEDAGRCDRRSDEGGPAACALPGLGGKARRAVFLRSEERRVGKEGRSRGEG